MHVSIRVSVNNLNHCVISCSARYWKYVCKAVVFVSIKAQNKRSDSWNEKICIKWCVSYLSGCYDNISCRSNQWKGSLFGLRVSHCHREGMADGNWFHLMVRIWSARGARSSQVGLLGIEEQNLKQGWGIPSKACHKWSIFSHQRNTN